jgi:uncharacterized protein (TIGR00255 family)
MLESMTAYGTLDFELNNYKYTIEIRSVNHRFFEFKFRGPSYLYKFEPLIRDTIKSKLQRGSIECYVKSTKASAKAATNTEPEMDVDYALMGEYIKALNEAQKRFKIEGTLTINDIIRLPNLFAIKEPEVSDDVVEKELVSAAGKCAGVVSEMQKKEGEKLKSAMEQHLVQIEHNTKQIEGKTDEMFQNSLKKIKDRLKELLSESNIPMDRITAEAGLMAEKLDISEEVERLGSHFSQFRETLKNKNNEPVGKKLDFIVQEINREINTIASKAEDTNVVYTAVENKTLTEKIREQVQNVK